MFQQLLLDCTASLGGEGTLTQENPPNTVSDSGEVPSVPTRFTKWLLDCLVCNEAARITASPPLCFSVWFEIKVAAMFIDESLQIKLPVTPM